LHCVQKKFSLFYNKISANQLFIVTL